MMTIDASVVMRVIGPHAPIGGPCWRMFDRSVSRGVTFRAPGLMWLEVRNGLLTGARAGAWTGEEADQAVHLLDRLPIKAADHERDRQRAYQLARRYGNHQIYDLVYVAMAERLGDQFVTVDEKLRKRLSDLDWIIAPAEA